MDTLNALAVLLSSAPEAGCGVLPLPGCGLLQEPACCYHVQGILNGIDTALWDPACDPLIPAPFTPERLEGKTLCKRCGSPSPLKAQVYCARHGRALLSR